MLNEKKKTIILTVILAAVALALLSVFIIDELKTSGKIVSSDTIKVMDEFDKYYNSKSKKIIYYASSECGYCSLQTPILETIAEDYDLDYYYIDSSKLGTKQRNEILEKLDIEHATPTTVVVENGQVIEKQIGFVSGQEYVEFLINAGVLEEGSVYSKEAYLNFIDYEQYEKLISDKSTHVITIGQTTCSHCIAIKPALNSIAEDYDLEINYLNITDLTDEQKGTLLIESLHKLGYDDPDFVEQDSFGTPLTLTVKKGKIIDYISGERTYSQLVKLFKNQGLISE